MRSLDDDPILPRGARWADQMASGLGEKYEVIVQGLPGRTTVHDDPVEGEYRNGQRMLRGVLESHRPIDLLIICLGTNDCKHRFGLLAQDIALGVDRLTREAAALGIVNKTLIVCPPPVREMGKFADVMAGAERRTADLAHHMAAVATANGAAFFDAGQVIAVDPSDGIHWSVESHAKLGAAMAEQVRAL